jgi:ABC-type multidrug transport system fused ATPase/permease subunit
VSLVSWTLSFLRPFRARVVVISILALTEIGLAALAPWPLKLVVDNVLGDRPLPGPLAALATSLGGPSQAAILVFIVVTGLLLQVAHEVGRMANTQLQVELGQRVVYRLRERLMSHLQALPMRHHLVTRTADSVYRLDADVYCVDNLVIGGLFPLVLAFVKLAVMFVVLVYVDPALGFLSLAVVPFLYLCLRYYSTTLTQRAERVKALESSLIERAFEMLVTIAAVKSFARERHELERFGRTGDDTMRARLSLTWQESLFSVAVTAITLAGTALVLIVGGLHVIEGTLTVGSLLVVIAYLGAVYSPISAIAYTAGSIQQAVVSARRVRELLALEPEPLEDDKGLDASAIRGDIRFDRVSFSYDGARRVLEEVSFRAAPGELVAIVGLTGAGKTTIANLVPRFFEPTAGRVLVDGVELKEYSIRSLRERIALVPQSPVLFSGTIGENIRYGRLDASDEDVEAAARAAHVHEFVLRLPQGYDTPVVEAGATLSGGERQRLGIARAILKNAPILILDEPTSSLDAISEATVFDALRRLRRGRTTIVIAHRLSTIRDANKILVLHEGRVIAQGTHDALMSSNALYRRLYTRLSLGRVLDEADPPEHPGEIAAGVQP